MGLSYSDNYFKFKANRALTVESIRKSLAKIQNVVNLCETRGGKTSLSFLGYTSILLFNKSRIILQKITCELVH